MMMKTQHWKTFQLLHNPPTQRNTLFHQQNKVYSQTHTLHISGILSELQGTYVCSTRTRTRARTATYHLQEAEVGKEHVVEVDWMNVPREVVAVSDGVETVRLVGDVKLAVRYPSIVLEVALTKPSDIKVRGSDIKHYMIHHTAHAYYM